MDCDAIGSVFSGLLLLVCRRLKCNKRVCEFDIISVMRQQAGRRMAVRGRKLPRRRVRSSRDRLGGVTYRIVTDNQGSVRLVVDSETGEVAQRLDCDSFGRVLRDTNPGFQPFGFQGGLYDPDTGLVEFGCRWYDAETGRWISKAPILLDGGWNVYAFCGNDPVNRADPSGLCEDPQQEKNKIKALRSGSRGASLLYAVQAGVQMNGGMHGIFPEIPGLAHMDYKGKGDNWLFDGEYSGVIPRGTVIRGDQMGNYMAGYAAGYSDYPFVLYFGVRAGGMLFTNGSTEDWMDSGSVPDIWNGYLDGYNDFKRDHPDRHYVRNQLLFLPF